MSNQAAHQVLMVRPCNFGYNPDTAVDNAMQKRIDGLTPTQVHAEALREFDDMVALLRQEGVEVVVVQDTNKSHPTPDSIFPNNWFTTHSRGNELLAGSHVCLYPMCAANRRRERDGGVLQAVASECGLAEVNDMSAFETQGRFLEGTGSMVLDHVARVAYMARSLRSDEGLFREWCKLYSFDPVIFDAVDSSGTPVYHTNVLMSIGSNFAILCSDVIVQKDLVEASLKHTGKQLLKITEKQMRNYAGNALEVHAGGRRLLVMSATGWGALSEEERAVLVRHCHPLTPDVKTIETIGGGSCRCMLAELFAAK